jgi:ribosomal protection tetracycline resistance protein
MEESQTYFREYINQGFMYPVLIGSALHHVGIKELLNSVVQYLSPERLEQENNLSAYCFKIQHDPNLGRLLYVRLFSGEVSVRESVSIYGRDTMEKVKRIWRIEGIRKEEGTTLKAGEVGILSGVSAKVGEIIGDPLLAPQVSTVIEPTMQVRVIPDNEKDLDRIVESLRLLEDEDPLLNVSWFENERELHLSLMGTVQMEVISEQLLDLFGLRISFGPVSIIYRETPIGMGEGCVEMRTPYCGQIGLRVSPLPQGSGLIYESELSLDYISYKFQREIEETVSKALQQGLHGWEVTDIKVTLVKGRDVKAVTNSSDFRILTPIALMESLADCGTTLLEPIHCFEVYCSQNILAKVMSDLAIMRADFETPVLQKERWVIRGLIPVSTSLNYNTRLSSISSGRGLFRTEFYGWHPCSLQKGCQAKRRTPNPLDRSKYLLYVSGKQVSR